VSWLAELRRRLAAAGEAFVDPLLVEPDDGGLQAELPVRPEPKDGLNSCVVVVLDSCRFDALAAAGGVPWLGELEQRWAWASWTAPSHHNLLTGLLPHRAPTRVFASEVYKEHLEGWGSRLGAELPLERFLPGLWLPAVLRWGLGMRTVARVSLPVLNPSTGINRDFDDYRLMERHADLPGILDSLSFDRPTFALLNVGETHYPYNHGGDEAPELPHVSGLHGVARRLQAGEPLPADAWFTDESLATLKQRQVDAAAWCVGQLEQLRDELPKGTRLIVTADHGELFGEGGYFGHGPIPRPEVFQVPYVEGVIR